MRRIPRPSRPLDQTLSSSQLLRTRVTSSQYRAAFSPHGPLRTTSTPFSTTPAYAFLTGKQDKKKHQAFVRRWQKRMLGDAEPIGAHVDPYDGTSPVRIAPEETGEEVEVLEEARVDEDGNVIEYAYEGAESGEGLYWIGGKDWVTQRKEEELEERFAQLVGRGYSMPSGFGRRTPVTDHTSLQQCFHRAVVEVYALQRAGLNMDLSTYPKRGEYPPPIDFGAVKLSKSQSELVDLNFPSPEARSQLLDMIQETPTEDVKAEEEIVAEGIEDPAVEELAKSGKAAETSPTMKAGPLIKHTEGKAFDFMSNRPVPRSRPAESVPSASEVKYESPISDTPSRHLDFELQAESSQKAIADLRHTIIDAAARNMEDAIASIRNDIRANVEALASQNIAIVQPIVETKYRHIPVTNPAVKFALAKRLLQLTGHRLPDPALNTSSTLGDLFAHLFSTSKPKPTKLFDQIKLASEVKPSTAFKSGKSTAKGSRNTKNNKPRAGDLLGLSNVKMQGERVSPWQKDQEVGRLKVIDYALMERGLPEIRRHERTL